jgi:hypothetical protein
MNKKGEKTAETENAINLRVSQNVGNSFSGRAAVGFSGGTRLNVVC